MIKFNAAIGNKKGTQITLGQGSTHLYTGHKLGEPDWKILCMVQAEEIEPDESKWGIGQKAEGNSNDLPMGQPMVEIIFKRKRSAEVMIECMKDIIKAFEEDEAEKVSE